MIELNKMAAVQDGRERKVFGQLTYRVKAVFVENVIWAELMVESEIVDRLRDVLLQVKVTCRRLETNPDELRRQ